MRREERCAFCLYIIIFCLLGPLFARSLDLSAHQKAFHESKAVSAMMAGKTRRLVSSGRHRRSVRSIQVYLNSRTGYVLGIHPNGSVYATNDRDANAKIEKIIEAVGLVSLKGVASGRYLAFSSSGKLTTTASCTSQNHFVEEVHFHGYNSYKTAALSGDLDWWYIGINPAGHITRGNRPHHNGLRHSDQFTLRAIYS